MHNKAIFKGGFVLILVSSLLTVLIGCEDISQYTSKSTTATEPTVRSVQMEYSDFNLVTDRKIGVIYIENEFYTYNEGSRRRCFVYTPYYSENGKLCKFVDGKVVEINDD